ncbi:MAG: AI-2E family transporter [Bacteroidales bacterium]|nr:AI-2E family transporter [Bacteroidales bacterium]
MNKNNAKTIEDSQPAWRRPYTFDRVVRMVLAALLICGVVWLLNRLSSVLLPFLVAWLIAYILEPFVQRNCALLRTKRRFMPIVFTLLELTMLLVVLGVLFIPSIFQEMHQLADLIRQYASTDYTVTIIPASIQDFLRDHIDFNWISDELTKQDMHSLIDMTTRFLAGGWELIMGVVNWFLVILYVVFIMLDYEKLLSGFKHMVPPRLRSSVFAVTKDVKESMNHYFRGQSLVALCVGVLFSIGFLMVGLPLAVVLGLFIGLLNMVPYLQLISIVPTTLLCLVVSVQDSVAFWPLWWECMLVYAIVQCIQDLFLTPKIMGKAMGLNPAIILLSLSVWGSLLGFIGLIIALPLTTLVLAYYNEYIIHRHDGENFSQRRTDAEDIDKAIEFPDD